MADKQAIADHSGGASGWWQRLGVWIASNVFRLQLAPRAAANDGHGHDRVEERPPVARIDAVDEELSWIRLVDGDALVAPASPKRRIVDVIDVHSGSHDTVVPAGETAAPSIGVVPEKPEAVIGDDDEKAPAAPAIEPVEPVGSITTEDVADAGTTSVDAERSDDGHRAPEPGADDDDGETIESVIIAEDEDASGVTAEESIVSAFGLAEESAAEPSKTGMGLSEPSTAPEVDAAPGGGANHEEDHAESLTAIPELEPTSDREAAAKDDVPHARRVLTDAERAPRRPRPVNDDAPRPLRRPRAPRPQATASERKPRKPIFVMDPALPNNPGLHNAYNIHDVLDALPDYFDHLKALRNSDPDAYDIFSGIGGQMCIKDRALFSGAKRVSEEFTANPPAIRCVFMPDTTGDDGRRIPAGALYMIRVKSGQLLVGQAGFCRIPSEGSAYRMTMTWRDDGNSALVATCFVQIFDDGSIKLLPERLPRTQVIKARRKGGGGTFQTMVNSTPGWVADLARDHKTTTDDWISLVVGMVASAKQPEKAILVRAQKDGMTAAWTIDRRDAKRFFISRNAGETDGGQRKRVLHYVAPFTRNGAYGIQNVSEHYRGDREFNWQGYDISISGLDFHHTNFFDSNVEAYEVEEHETVPRTMMTMRQLAKNLKAHYSRARFLSKRRKKVA